MPLLAEVDPRALFSQLRLEVTTTAAITLALTFVLTRSAWLGRIFTNDGLQNS